MAHALAPLRSPRRGSAALALALAKKLAEVLAILCIQRAFGVVLPVASAVLVLAALNLATLLPVVPANVGVYEAVVVLAYGYFGVAPERALAMGLVQHACYFAALALPGYGWLLRSRLRGAPPPRRNNRDAAPRHQASRMPVAWRGCARRTYSRKGGSSASRDIACASSRSLRTSRPSTPCR